MNSLRTSRRTRTRGFTLTELLISTGVAGAVGLMAFGTLLSTMTLSSQNIVTNISNLRARQTLDRLGSAVRFATETPVMITTAGATVTGTTSDGLSVKNSQGGPYTLINANAQIDAEIPSGATSFIAIYSTAAGVGTPVVGDYLSINLATQPQLEITGVAPLAAVNGLARATITTKTGLTEAALPGSYSVTASRYRREAYIFVQSGTSWDLRYYPRVTSTTSYSASTSYRVLGSGFQKIGTQAWFTKTTANGTQSTWLQAVVRSSNRAEYAESVSGKSTLTTMPVQVKLWNYTAPPPP